MCGDEEVARKVTSMFLKDSPICMTSIAEAIKEQNPKYVSMYAHSLKGAALQISATKLSEYALQLETAGKEKKSDTFTSLYDQIKEEFDKVVIFMSQENWIEIAKEYEQKHSNT
ncbi:MAG: Hpt domain-containing protein [Candidatus Brocadiia bacterium]|nr:MAG: Hpt domain-containing protein [Candidatus Brocadiia bacterium]